MEFNRKAVVIIISILAVLSFSIPLSAYYIDHASKSVAPGPQIEVRTQILNENASPFISGPGSGLNLSNVTVAIFSPVPTSLNSSHTFNLSDVNQTNNPYEVRLFQGNANAQGIVMGHLSDQFFTIVKEWKNYMQNNTQQVSLMMYASLLYERNNSLYVYSYYNNIPFNPMSTEFLNSVPGVLSAFNLSISFDIAHPSDVFPVNATATPAGTIGPGSCRTQTDYTTTYDKTINTEIPLMSATLGPNSNSELNYGFTSFSGSLEMSFNSASKNTLQSYAIMTSSPSWSGTDNSFAESSASMNAYPQSNENVSMIYIPSVTLHVVATEITYQYDEVTYCKYVNGGTTTSITVTGVSNSNFDPYETFLSNVANSPYWYAIFGALAHTSDGQVSLSPGQTYSQWSFTGAASGYTSAASAEQTAVNAVSVTMAGIGLGLAVATAAGVIPGASSAADAVDLVNEALAGASLDLAILSAFSSISYSTTLQMQYNTFNVGNAALGGTSGSNLNVNIFQASSQTQLDANGGVYYVNMPLTYVVGTAN